MKVHKLTIKNNPGAEDQLTKGANTSVLLDGQPLGCVSNLKFEIDAGGMAKVTMEIYVEVDIDINLAEDALKTLSVKETIMTTEGKTYTLHSVGSLSPIGYVETK